MKPKVVDTDSVPGINEALTEEQAREIIAKGPEWIEFVLLQLSGAIKGLRNESSVADQSPSAPPSATPVYKKPPAKRRRGKKRGAQMGHPGSSRQRAAVIDRVEEHFVDLCPECGDVVVPCRGKGRTRSRVIEDIPEETRVEAVEHLIHRAYCPKCKKTVEPKVGAALPGSQVGHRAVTLASWFRFGLGIPLNKIAEILNSHLSFQVSN